MAASQIFSQKETRESAGRGAIVMTRMTLLVNFSKTIPAGAIGIKTAMRMMKEIGSLKKTKKTKKSKSLKLRALRLVG